MQYDTILRIFFSLGSSESSVRKHVFVDLRKRYKTIDEAEAALGLMVESYIDSSPAQTSLQDDIDQTLNLSPSLAGKLTCPSTSQLMDLVIKSLQLIGPNVDFVTQLLLRVFNELKDLDVLNITEQIYSWLPNKVGITSTVLGFVTLSLEAMKRLEENNTVNLVIKFCQGLATDRPDKCGPLVPLHRMPFGLLQYCIEFFTCTNVMQVILVENT